MDSLNDKIKARINVGKDSNISLLDAVINKVEKSLIKIIIDFLDKFNTNSGSFVDSKDNDNLLNELTTRLKTAYKKSGIFDEVKKYLKNFDRIESLDKEIYRSITKTKNQKKLTKAFKKTNPQKTKYANDLIRGLTDLDVVSVNFLNDIRDILFESIVFERSVADTRKIIRDRLRSQEDGKKSKLYRYAQQISSDTLNGYAGASADLIRREMDYDGFSFLGSNKPGSRTNCVNLTCDKGHPKFTGKFDSFKLKGKNAYRVADLQKIIDKMQEGSSEGFNPNTTPETFATYRGGFNCDDYVIYFDLLDEDVEDDELSTILED